MTSTQANKPNIHLHNGQPVVSTVDVALAFGRPHNQIMKGIRRTALDTSIDFIPATWRDRKHRVQPAYHLTHAGFALLTRKWRTGGDQALRDKSLTTWQEFIAFYAPAPVAQVTDGKPGLSGELQTVEFHGQALYLIEKDGEPYVPMKAVVEGMGLDWRAQLQRIKRHPVLSKGVVIVTTPSFGGDQQQNCLPLHMLNGWLFGINTNQIKNNLREPVIQYQEECWEALSEAKEKLAVTSIAQAVEARLPTFPEDGLVTVRPGEIGGMECMVVDARELHQRLGVAAHFRNWIARRLKEYGFQADSDFRPILGESLKGRPSKEYHLSLDTAKEMAMVEKNEMGRKIRRYFIECEQRLIQSLQQQAQSATDLTLTENEVRYLHFLKATHGLSGASTRQPFKNQVSPNAAAVMWYLDKREPEYPNGWHRCSIREVATALNLNPGNVATVIRTLNQWDFLDSRYSHGPLASVHQLQLKVIDQVIERNQLDGALGALLAKLPEPSTALH